ncbi:AbrB/MazE/SpoVT family DNA-binding domain-containing protein [Alkalihalobacterium alkalinitrilicum]|uniref:AbrB/MazE/SpoVT family DNA-binding domain-containing protein n=1 Tax=Alkalihalobacterium alkalinitrilicum TaxID=427920 RepID=UPI0015D5B1F9|nr:AbrB/MazE/SpoVT family DNA-binding domain-containing protein [Alkalihalobacterium alkalinitrilicum]
MKALGIVRRIDELGRVTIPMEIRKENGWVSGTPMEMFATEEGFLVREYKIGNEQKELLKALNETMLYTQNDQVKELLSKTIKFITKG